MVVLSTELYDRICGYIGQYNGLTIDCDRDIRKEFPAIDTHTLSAVLSKEWQKRIKRHHYTVLQNAQAILKRFRRLSAAAPHDPHILVRIAIAERFSPISLCRILLSTEYSDQPKVVCQEMLNNPTLIPNVHLAQNIAHCLYNENYDGQIADIIRRTIGEDYEVRLKKFATDAGMEFHDEVYLRRHGYDKTPDLKLAVPCLYKGRVINWIESKASFGDFDSHRRYVSEQLASYGNRFGAGIVIYWFGYLDKVAECRENTNMIIVADQFPAKEDLVFLDYGEN